MIAMEQEIRERGGGRAQRGFTLLELIIAMGITLAVLAAASVLCAAAFGVRRRENDRTDALAKARLALGSMAREVAGAGLNLPKGGYPANGIVAGESGAASIRFLSNRGGANTLLPTDPGEDVRFLLANNPAGSGNRLLRHDYNAPAADRSALLVDSVDALAIQYFDGPVEYAGEDCDVAKTGGGGSEVTDPAAARFIVITMCVNLPPAGSPGSPGYQPAGRVQVSAAAALTNANLVTY